MAYQKRVYTDTTEEVVTFEDMNRIETGIETNDLAIAQINDDNIERDKAISTKETTTGSQEKANAALKSSKEYADGKVKLNGIATNVNFIASDDTIESLTQDNTTLNFVDKRIEARDLYTDFQELSAFLQTESVALATPTYNFVARNKKVNRNSYITAIKLQLANTVDKGFVRLCKFNLENKIITNYETDNMMYYFDVDKKEVKLDYFFKVEKDKYIGLEFTPSASNMGIRSQYPSTGYENGFIGTKKVDGTFVTLANYFPAMDFTLLDETITNTMKLSSRYGEIQNSWLKGKTWVAYGDSITAGYGLANVGTEPTNNNNVNSYVKRIANRNGMTFYNYGTSGRGFSVGGAYKLYNTLSTYGSTVVNPDIVTVAMGTNDYGLVTADNNVAFGTYDDAVTTDSFCGWFKKTMELLQQLYPNAVIIVFTPIPRPNLLTKNTQGKTLVDYTNAIKDLGASYGVYVADVLTKCRFNLYLSSWKDTYMTDRLHPTQAGVDKYLVPLFEREMINAKVE